MASRVLRMVMVNLGSVSGGVSGRITEIDPRGGAAVKALWRVHLAREG